MTWDITMTHTRESGFGASSYFSILLAWGILGSKVSRVAGKGDMLPWGLRCLLAVEG